MMSNAVTCNVVETTVTCSGTGILTADILRSSGSYGTFTHAIIKQGVTVIGEQAFMSCGELSRIELPSGLEAILEKGFDGCVMTEITLPGSIMEISALAFNNCPNHRVIKISGSCETYKIIDGMLCSSDGETLILVPGALTTGTLTIPSSIKQVNASAARWNQATTIVIPDNVELVRGNSFFASKATTVKIGKNAKFSGTVFQSAGNIKSITLDPDNPHLYKTSTAFGRINDNGKRTSIDWIQPGTSEFTIEEGIKKIYLPVIQAVEELTKITSESETFSVKNKQLVCEDDLLVACAGGATEVTIHEDIKRIDSYAFTECKRLTSITLHSGMTSINTQAIRECPALTTIDFQGCTLTDQTETGAPMLSGYMFFRSYVLKNIYNWPKHSDGSYGIEELAFSETSVKTLELPNRVKYIGHLAFSFCQKLESITIPETVELIDTQAFYGCTALTEIKFSYPSSLRKVASQAFGECLRLGTVTLPQTVTSLIAGSFGGCDSLTNIKFKDDTGDYISDGKAAYHKKGSIDYYKLVIVPAGATSFTMHTATRIIGTQAFYGCRKLVTVVMNNLVEEIEPSAFFQCDRIEFIRLTPKIAKIGQNAFHSCRKLNRILYCSNNSNVQYTWDPFPTNPKIYAQWDYPKTTFCEHSCQRILDWWCNTATHYFSDHTSVIIAVSPIRLLGCSTAALITGGIW